MEARETLEIRGVGPAARAVVVHDLAQARLTLAVAETLGVSVTLVSPPGAAASMGAGYFQAMVTRAGGDHPRVSFSAVLDCADAPGLVLAALRQGLLAIRFTGSKAVAAKLAEIATQQGATLVCGAIESLDLLKTAEPEVALRAWLARPSGSEVES